MKSDFKIMKSSVLNNPFIGLYARANDSVAFCSKSAPRKFAKSLEGCLNVQVIDLFIANSPLVGIFSAMNGTGCVLTAGVGKREVNAVKKAGLNTLVLESSFAPGNNILANDKAALVNPLMEKREIAYVQDVLGVEVHAKPIMSLRTVGSANVVTNRGLLAFNEAGGVEVKQLEKWFGVRGAGGTANMAVAFNGISVVANKHGALAGDLTSGFEAQRIFEALGD